MEVVARKWTTSLHGCNVVLCALKDPTDRPSEGAAREVEPVFVSPELVKASLRRNERQRTPFILSRLAASACIQMVNDVPTKVNFVGSREEAEKVHNVHISLSHEDELGACVGWKASTSSDGAVFAVDVADVTAVAHTAAKYPQFRARWLPQVKLTNERQQGSSPLGGPPLRSWWRSGCGQCGDELIRASHAIILAQHWSVRECCVKLQGIGGKSFDYSCVVPLLNSPYPTESFRPQFLFPHTVYAGVITGEEAHVMQKRELGCGIRIETALDWVYSRKLKCKKPMVVTVASCDRSRLL